jgi:TonB family protein
MRLWLLFFAFSLCVHLIVWTAFVHPQSPLNLRNHAPIDVTIVEKEEPVESNVRHNRVVKELLPPLDMLKPMDNTPASYEGYRDQRVKKEMVAKNQGPDKNRITKAQKSSGNNGDNGDSKELKLPNQGKELEKGEGGIAVQKASPSKRLGKLGQTLFMDQSTYSQYLPDTEDGPVTALNTERFVFASFFNRLEDRFVPIWQRNFRDTISRMPADEQRRIFSQPRWVTQVEILLNKEGYVQRVNILNGSGSTPLDNDAARAFQENQYYPNPPKQMVKQDGHIHLLYNIALYTTSEWARR